MQRIAIFPGSFDPFTIGHESVVKRSLPLFDKIIVAIGINSTKKSFFSIQQRINIINTTFEGIQKISVLTYQGLTVDFCKQIDAGFILRGLRTAADFEYERAIAQMNKEINPDIETIFMLTAPQHTHIASTIVREVLHYGGDVSKFLPQNININDFL